MPLKDKKSLPLFLGEMLTRIFHADRLQKPEIMMNTTLDSHVDLGSRDPCSPAPQCSSGLSHQISQLPCHDQHKISGFMRYLQSSKQTLAFIGNVTLSTLRFKKFRWIDALVQMQQCWQSSIFIVSLISFLLGVILAFQSAMQLRQYGAGIFVADLVGLAVVREMGPMMAAIVVAGGTGAGFAASLGNMRVNEEIDALATLGISSIDFLVLPRLLAATIMMPILTLYANLFGILGGLFVSSTVLNIPVMAYWIEIQNRLGVTDVALGIIKSFFFGMIIALTGCWRGLQCSRDTTGVGVATSSAVVTSIMLIVVGDALFAVIYHAMGI